MIEKVAILVLFVVWMILPGMAQNRPGALEDAAIERQRLLRAADQLDTLTHKLETMQLEVAGLREEIAKLKNENTQLRGELAALETRQNKSREALIEEVGKIVAESEPPSAPATQPSQGYEHIVEKGQSLWAIANAFQKQGVKVSVDDIRKANNLKEEAILRVGQKLFIPEK